MLLVSPKRKSIWLLYRDQRPEVTGRSVPPQKQSWGDSCCTEVQMTSMSSNL